MECELLEPTTVSLVKEVKTDMKEISRRRLFQSAALASALPLVNSFAGRAAAQGRRLPAGGRGPVQVLLVTKGHAFNRAPFFEMFDALGETITWTHVEHPAAQVFFDPKYAEPYDAFVYYDMAGRGGRNPDGSPNDIVPSDEMKKNFAALLRQGKGMVFFHHALASWVHTWPEYIEVMGGACDWGRTIENVRGKAFPFSGYRGGMEEHVTVVDKNHPVTQGLGDGFDIVDETYLCPMFEDSVHPLIIFHQGPFAISGFPQGADKIISTFVICGRNIFEWPGCS